jgi:SAM-dependent methyltransferase
MRPPKSFVTNQAKDYYDNIYRFNSDEAWNEAPGKKVLLSAFAELTPKHCCKIMDIGCGNGYFINEVRKLKSSHDIVHLCYGIDISAEAIGKAKRLYPGIDYQLMDAVHLAYEDNFFDIIFSYGVIEHIYTVTTAIKEIGRVLKHNGLFFILLPSLEYYRNDRSDEGWYHDLDGNTQLQWNFRRKTWEGILEDAQLHLDEMNSCVKYGALKPGVFFFGRKSNNHEVCIENSSRCIR